MGGGATRALQVTREGGSQAPPKAGTLKDMSNDDKAAESREGLLDSVKGKAKEVAGAVSGKDHLVEEGQLQQAAASDRKAALADEAVADAKRAEATREMREPSGGNDNAGRGLCFSSTVEEEVQSKA